MDGYFQEYHPGLRASQVHNRSMFRLSSFQRRQIALEHHTDEEIDQVVKEIKEIQLQRLSSSREPEEDTVRALIAQSKRKRTDMMTKKDAQKKFDQRKKRFVFCSRFRK